MIGRSNPSGIELVAFLAAVMIALPVGAQIGGQPTVEITSPAPHAPAFGVIVVHADVVSPAPLRSVECVVDGRSLGSLKKPPFRWQVDVGEDNEERVIEVIAETYVGGKAHKELRTPRIEVDEVLDVELLQVYAVVEKNGERQTDLPKSAFRVINDHGKSQEIVTFEGGDLPISAAILVDSSASMGGSRLSAALSGVQSFARGLNEEDEAMLVLFSDQILRLTPFTSDPAVLQQNVLGVQAVGSTSINDHLYFALNRLDMRLGRRVVVLLSDGDDITSLLPMDEVLWRARRSQAVIYWIRLEDGDEASQKDKPRLFTSSWRSAEANADEQESMRRAVADSGGREIVVRRLEDLEASFSDVVDELRDQFVLGFYPSDRRNDGSWRRFEVKVSGGFKVRTRAGFVDE